MLQLLGSGKTDNVCTVLHKSQHPDCLDRSDLDIFQGLALDIVDADGTGPTTSDPALRSLFTPKKPLKHVSSDDARNARVGHIECIGVTECMVPLPRWCAMRQVCIVSFALKLQSVLERCSTNARDDEHLGMQHQSVHPECRRRAS